MSDARTIMHFESMKKSTTTAYLLWWFTGAFGGHRFYLGRTGTAVAMLLITVFSCMLMIVLIGFVTVWVPIVWAIVDAFLIPGMVREYNLRLASALAP